MMSFQTKSANLQHEYIIETARHEQREQGNKEQETQANFVLGDFETDNLFGILVLEYFFENVLGFARYKQQEAQQHLELAGSHNENQTAIQQNKKALEMAREQGCKVLETQACLGLGDANRFDNQYQKAIPHYEKALEIAGEQGYKLEKTKAYLGLGDAYKLDNQYQTAIQHLEKALEIAREQGYKEKETQAYLGLGEAYKLDNQYQTAIEHYEKALEIAREQGYKLQETQVYLGLGNAYGTNNQNQTAIQYYEKALEIAHELYMLEEAEAFGLAEEYGSNNQIQTTIQHSEIGKEEGYRKMEAKACLGLGEAYRSDNQNQRAIQHYEKALQIAKEQGYKLLVAAASLALGEVYSFDNENQRAIQQYEKALEIAREEGYELVEVAANFSLAKAYGSDNQNQRAIHHYEKALKIANEQGYKLQETIAYIGLAETYRSDNHYQKAIHHYEKALEIANEQGYKLQETILAYLGLAEAYRSDNQCQMAIDHYEKALEIANEQGYKLQETTAYIGLAEAYRSDNQYEKAIHHYKKALEIANEQGYKFHETIAYLGLAEAYRSDNQYQEVIHHYEKALQIAREEGYELQEILANFTLAKGYQSNNENQLAIEHYEKALEIAKEHGQKLLEAQIYICLGAVFTSKNDIRTATQHYRNSLAIAAEGGYKKLEEYASEELSKFAEQFLSLAVSCETKGQNKEAIENYEEAKKIAKKNGEKYLEYRTNQAIGNSFFSSGNLEKAKSYYEQALENAEELCDEHREVASYLGLGAILIKWHDYEKARIWYDMALCILGTEHDDNILKEKALVGLGIAWFKLGNIQKASESIQSAQNLAKKETDKDACDNDYGETTNVSDDAQLQDTQREKGDHVNRLDLKNESFIDDRPPSKKQLSPENSYANSAGKNEDDIKSHRKSAPFENEKGRKDCKDKFSEELGNTESIHAVENEEKLSKNVTISQEPEFKEDQSDKDYLDLHDEETLEMLTKPPQDIIRRHLKSIRDSPRDNLQLHNFKRDLKPFNILSDTENKWLLEDFDIGRILKVSEITHVNIPKGSDGSSKDMSDGGKSSNVLYMKESNIQATGMVAFHILAKGGHPFGEKPDRLRNLLDGKPVGLDTLKDAAAKDLIAWMLSHDPNDRPSANEALKHPYLQPREQQFEMLCKVGNQSEMRDFQSDVVRKLNIDLKNWRNLMQTDVLKYLSTDSSTGRRFFYRPSWTDCLRLIRNVKEHWEDRPRPRPEAFYIVGNPQEFFLNLFPSLPVHVHRIIRSCDWKERDDLKEYFT